MDLKSILPDEMFTERAETRVKLGLLVSELVQDLGVRAEPNKVRELIEDIASTYQDPTEVINWYYEDNDEEATGYQDALQRAREASQQ